MAHFFCHTSTAPLYVYGIQHCQIFRYRYRMSAIFSLERVTTIFLRFFLPRFTCAKILAPTHTSTERVLYFFWYSFNTKTVPSTVGTSTVFFPPTCTQVLCWYICIQTDIFSQCNMWYIVHIFGYSGHTLEICSRNLWKLNCTCLSE